MGNNVYFTNIQEKIAQEINEAQDEILIAVAWFTNEYLLNQLYKAGKRGVQIKILIYDDDINKKTFYEDLHKSGQEIYLSTKLMHNKFCIVDRKTLINGSYNWTNAAKFNNENIQITLNDPQLVTKFITEFDKIIKSAKSIESHFQNIGDELEFYISQISTPQILPCVIRYKKRNAIYIKSNKEFNNYITYFFKTNKNISNTLIPETFDSISNMTDKVINLNKDFEAIEVNPIFCMQNNNYWKIFDTDGNILFSESKKSFGEDIKLVFHNFEEYIGINTGNNVTFFYHKIFKTFKQLNRAIFHNSAISFSEIYDFTKKVRTGTVNNRPVYEYKHSRRLYGLMDLNNNIIIPPIFDKIFSHNETEIIFISRPDFEKLYINKKNDFHGKVYEFPFFYENEFRGKMKSYRYCFSDGTTKPFTNSLFHYTDRKEYIFIGDYFGTNIIKILKYFYLNNHSFDIAFLNFLQKAKDLHQIEESNIKSYIEEQIKKFNNAKILTPHQKQSCYIATVAYGSNSHSNVKILRKYRDDYLLTFWLGILNVKIYYYISPRISKYLSNKKILNTLIRFFLNKFIYILKMINPKYNHRQW